MLARSCRPGYPSENVKRERVDDWMSRVKEMGVRSIICLLSDRQLEFYARVPGGLLGYYREQGLCVERFCITDPARDERAYQELEENLDGICRAYVSLSKPVLIHCSAGIERTGIAVEYIQNRLREEDRNGD